MPLSKSISNRRLVLDWLAGVSTAAENVADCDDTRAIINAFRDIEAGVERVNVGAAGTAMRFLTACLASTPGREVVIDGSERMRHRPIGALVDALKSLGADIEWMQEPGFPPLKIRGRKLSGGKVVMPGDVSSQFVSALMMIASTMEHQLELTLIPPVVSRPYIEMTRKMIAQYNPDAGRVEADWSAASYWYEIMALTGQDVKLNGLKRSGLQGDEAVEKYFEEIFRARRDHSSLMLDLSDTPDLAQTVVVTCCALGIPFRCDGLSTLPLKETDRLAALKQELGKLGFEITIINGESIEYSGNASRADGENLIISTYDDHRMAMSFAPMAVLFPGLTIQNPDVVTKSYPGFWNDLMKAGFETEFFES